MAEDYVTVPTCPRCGGTHPDKYEPAWNADDGEDDYPNANEPA